MAPSPATILDTSGLRTKWKNAKTLAEKAAGSKEGSALSKLHKEKMKDSLGPDLEAWPKSYPKYDKLEENKKKLDTKLDAYTKAVKESTLSDPVKKPMLTALKEIKEDMNGRLKKAELLIMSDPKLESKLPKNLEEEQTKVIQPIKLFFEDVANEVAQKAGTTKFKPTSIPLEVILTDERILKHIPNNVQDGLLKHEMYDKANRGQIITDLVNLLKSVDKLDPNAAKTAFDQGHEKIIEKALERAGEPILRLVKIRAEYRMYKVKKGVTLTLAVGSAMASVAGLAVTPFTGGASTVAGILGLIKSVNIICTEVAGLAATVEGFIDKVTEDIDELVSDYKNVGSTGVGIGETGKTVVNSLIGPAFNTIKDAKKNCDQVNDKINGLETKAHDQATLLGGWMDKQTATDKALKQFEDQNKGKLTPKEAEQLKTIGAKVAQAEKAIPPLLTSIPELYKRVKTNTKTYKELKVAIDTLAAKEPTWAKIAEVLIPVATSVGLMVAGNVGVPEPMEFLKLAHTVVEDTKRVLEPLETAKDLAEDLVEMVKEHNKKK